MKNNERGITLVALVVTIIILIILATVSISMVLGQNGLINRARQAREMTINEQTSENGIYGQGEDYINSYLTGTTSSTISSNPTNPTTTYTAYTLGQEVTVGGEKFFVIEENDTTSKNTITLITKYNLNPSSNTQLNANNTTTTFPFCIFSIAEGKPYWYETGETSSKYPYDLNGVESEKATAYNKAVSYGLSKGGQGRLLTLSEAERLLLVSENIQKIINGQDYAQNPVESENYLRYWLGTAMNGDDPYCAMVNGWMGADSICIDYLPVGKDEGFVDENSFYVEDTCVGVRPVITVSKSLVS